MSSAASKSDSDKQLQQRRIERLLVNVVWLIRLRWVAVVGQFITIGVASIAFRIELQLIPLLLVVGLTGVSNFAFSVWFAQQMRRGATAIDGGQILGVIVAVMTLDLLSLTVLLYFSGGTANPFLVFYFVNLALAAVVLPARWSWTLTVIAVLCLAFLFITHIPLSDLETIIIKHSSTGEGVSLGQIGLLVALTACSVVVVYFVTRVTRELRQRERQLRTAEQQRAQAKQLEALGTLAAGAGHELATPLSTIAVVSKELTRHLDGVDVPASVLEDVTLIRAEVDRCRAILDRMSVSLGRNEDEPWTEIPVSTLVADVLDGLGENHRVTAQLDDAAKNQTVRVPEQTIAQAIRGVVQNALDASETDQLVELSATANGGNVNIEIRDRGQGMSEEAFSRAGEPFYTTKEPGQGMGLGLFLTRSVVERLGGSLELHSPGGEGVKAVIRIPLVDVV